MITLTFHDDYICVMFPRQEGVVRMASANSEKLSFFKANGHLMLTPQIFCNTCFSGLDTIVKGFFQVDNMITLVRNSGSFFPSIPSDL